MSFTSLRQEINRWTLHQDDTLFAAVRELSDAVLTSERQITDQIAETKHSLHEGNVNLGFNFSQFMQLSEAKFTENKIEQRVEEDKEKKEEKQASEPRSRMDMLKEALSVGMKNVDIKEDDHERDNMSVATVSEYSFSMHQAVFKNTRMPPLFGSREFATQPYLTLFTQEDANQIQEIHRQSVSSQLLAQIDMSSSGPPDPSSLPPPPPPLAQVLGSVATSNDANLNQAPTNIPPKGPQPPSILFPTDESDIREVSQHQMDVKASFASSNSGQPLEEALPALMEQQRNDAPQQRLPPPPQPQLKPMNIHDELNMKLAQGRPSQVQQIMPIPEASHKQEQSSVIDQRSSIRQSVDDPKAPPPMLLPQPQQQLQASPANRGSLRPQYSLQPGEIKKKDFNFRQQSANYNQIVSQSQPRFGQPSTAQTGMFDEEEEQEQNALFGKKKTRKREPQPSVAMTEAEQKKKQQEEEQLMKKSTYNDDAIFKKKANPAASIIMKKSEFRKKNILQQEDEEESPVELKRPVKKESSKPAPVKDTKKSPLFGAQEDEEPVIKPIKKQPTKAAQPKAKKGALFEDQEQEEDLFKKKKKDDKPKESAKKAGKGKNLLLAEEDSDEDFFKKTPKKDKPQDKKIDSPVKDVKQKEVIPTKQSPVVEKIVPVTNIKQPQPEVEPEAKSVQSKQQPLVLEQPKIQETVPVAPKPEPVKEKVAEVKQAPKKTEKKSLFDEDAEEDFGSLRRKKKPQAKQALFDDDEDDFKPASKPVAKKVEPEKQVVKVEPIKVIQAKPEPQEQRHEIEVSEQPKKKDPMKVAGVAMGMGIGPLIPKGMVLSKPSEIKNQEKIARESLDLREQEEANARAQQEEEERKEQQRLKKENAERQQRERKERERHERLQREQQQEKQRQKEERAAEEARIRKQQEDEHQRLIALQRQREQQQRQLDIQRQKQEEERLRLIQLQRQEQERLQQLQLQRQKEELREQQRKRAEAEQARRQQEERERAAQAAQTKKSPLGGGLVPKMPSKASPLGLPSIPSPSKAPQQAKKKGLFDEQEDAPSVPVKKVEKKPVSSKPKKGLFDEDDDGSFNFSFKPKEKKAVKKPTGGLFGDEDDEPLTTSKKKPAEKPQKKGLFDDEQEPVKDTKPAVAPAPKPAPKSKLNFDDEQDDFKPKAVKVEPPAPVHRQPQISDASIAASKPKKKGLLFDDGDDEPALTVSKKATPEPVASKPASIKPTLSEPKEVEQPKPAAKKKGLLFGDDEDDGALVAPKKTTKPAKKTGGLFADDDDSLLPKRQPKAEQPKPAKQNLFGDDDAPVSVKPAAKPARNKRKLFDDSD